MLSKSKYNKTATELDTARSKLNFVLQDLLDKAEESSSSSSDESLKLSCEIQIKEEVVSPSKKPAAKTQRKRKRKEDALQKSGSSYIQKLYERSVDLAQFSEDLPLYPICRAWIRNNPYSEIPPIRCRSATPPPAIDPENENENDSVNLYNLPRPVPRIKEEFVRLRDHRIPSPEPQLTSNDEFFDCLEQQNSHNAPPIESLKSKHMLRWKTVRQKWKDAAATNEERYRESGSILRTMFERSSCRDQSVASSEQWNGGT